MRRHAAAGKRNFDADMHFEITRYIHNPSELYQQVDTTFVSGASFELHVNVAHHDNTLRIEQPPGLGAEASRTPLKKISDQVAVSAAPSDERVDVRTST